jgi:hypothetical protein
VALLNAIVAVPKSRIVDPQLTTHFGRLLISLHLNNNPRFSKSKNNDVEMEISIVKGGREVKLCADS